jgi:CRISPR-associated endonuclease/helicase Cas3
MTDRIANPPTAHGPYYAHTAELADGTRDPDKSKWQHLADHLRNVAELAATFAAPMGPEAAAEARLAGLLHDLGKYQPDFQHYLAIGRPRTPHAIHGAAVVAPQSRLIANLIASHHAGLHDEVDSLSEKINELTQRPEGQKLLRSLIGAYQADALPSPPKPSSSPLAIQGNAAEDLQLRLLLSALVDADYIDTERHFLAARGITPPSAPPATPSELLAKLNAKLTAFAQRTQPSSLDRLRTQIATRCTELGRSAPPGVFSLTVPTGGGKTLASAAFALNHAVAHGLGRVIYVIPYTSIIEQNARVFASVFGPENVLEHHSLADWQAAAETDLDPDSPAARAKHSAENWDAPFIVTTNVQFFESLHSHRPSAARKLHRLIGSIVLFDECQTFPPELLNPTLATLQALQAYGKTSLVFCTATQPAFEHREFFPAGFPAIREIIPGSDPAWFLHARPEFRRTSILHARQSVSLEPFADRVAAHDRALAIVNTRRSARDLFDAVQSRSPGEHVYHLSTLMCPAHRQTVLDAVRIRLEQPDCPCLLISTQLIEAGVDLDFPKVFRVLGPLDAILQAAGRCNREGRLRDADGNPVRGEVEVVQLADAKLPPGVYQRATALAEKYLPVAPADEITPEAITAYFRDLYQGTALDKHDIARLRRERLHREVGLRYKWIEEEQPTESVLTDYDETARAWIAQLDELGHQPPTRRQRHEIARYCINMRASDVKTGLQRGIIRQLRNSLHVVQKSYDPQFGYDPKGVITGAHTIC